MGNGGLSAQRLMPRLYFWQTITIWKIKITPCVVVFILPSVANIKKKAFQTNINGWRVHTIVETVRKAFLTNRTSNYIMYSPTHLSKYKRANYYFSRLKYQKLSLCCENNMPPQKHLAFHNLRTTALFGGADRFINVFCRLSGQRSLSA